MDFYAHQESRKNEYEIGQQCIESGFEYFAGGRFRIPNGKEETLILVTADHETGGLSLGYGLTENSLYLEQLAAQKISYEQFYLKYVRKYVQNHTEFDEVLSDLEQLFGLVADGRERETGSVQSKLSMQDIKELKEAYEETFAFENGGKEALTDKAYVMHGNNDPFTSMVLRIVSNKAGISWSTHNHSGVSVPVFALGKGQEMFTGYYNNTDICKKLESLTNCK